MNYYDELLIAGNKLVYLFEFESIEELDFSLIGELDKIIYSLQSNNQVANINIVKKIRNFLISWIRSIHNLLFNDENLNFVSVEKILIDLKIRDLDYGMDIKWICKVIENENDVDEICIDSIKTESIIKQALNIIFIQLYKNIEVIKSKVSNIIINTFEDEDIVALLKMMTSIKVSHLNQFKERREIVNKIVKKLQTKNTLCNKYLVLTGVPAIGKTSVCLKVVEELCIKQGNVGRYANNIKEIASWVPTLLLHLGKQSKELKEIVRSIVVQANTKLVNKIDIARLNKNYSRIIHDTLSRLVKECGYAILIIDAIDEIATDNGNLDFLPEEIPIGATIFVTMNCESEELEWIEKNRKVDVINLEPLKREEIPSLTGVADLDFNGKGKVFNDTIFNKYGDRPKYIFDIIDQLQMHNNDINKINFTLYEEKNFEYECLKWFSEDRNERELIQQILLLLAVFEPVYPLNIELLQLFLRYENYNLCLPDIRAKLYRVSNQIEGFNSIRIKIANKKFAEYVRNFYFSRIDIQDFLKYVFKWFAIDKKVPLRLICQFFQYWSNSKKIGNQYFVEQINKFVKAAKTNTDSERLLGIAEVIWNEQFDIKEIAVKCVEASINLENIDAKIIYANRLLEGDGVDVNKSQGEKLLREAANTNNKKAKVILGNRLLNGNRVDKNIHEAEVILRDAIELGDTNAKGILGSHLVENYICEKKLEGIQLLRQAVDEGDSIAKSILGNRLIDGYGITRDEIEGEKLLREAVNAGNLKAKLVLANRLVEGFGLKLNEDEGEKMLRELAEIGDLEAKVSLSSRLLDGLGAKNLKEEGEKLLREASEAGNIEAKIHLAIRLIEGNNIEKNVIEGEKVLRDASALGSTEAKLELANRLLDARGLKRNFEEGKTLLISLAKTDDANAKTYLANRLLDGDVLERDIINGQNILQEAVMLGNKQAKLNLAERLLEGDVFEKDKQHGEKLLRELVADGLIIAKAILAIRLLDGDGVDANKNEGERLLREVALQGYQKAKLVLSNRLLGGVGLTKNTEEGECLLRELVNLGNKKAKLILANRLLDGDEIKRNKQEGERLLRELVAIGYVDAKLDLGDRLLDGDGVVKDSSQGELLIREAIISGSKEAKIVLANRLLDGKGVIKNVEEGEKFLSEAIDAGDKKAKFIFAIRLLDGNGLKKDSILGEKILKELADENEDIKLALANRLIDGRGMEKNIIEGEKILRILESNGNNKARLNLAGRLLDGDSLEKDVDLGEKLLRKASDDGYIEATFELANRLIDGKGLTKNIEEGEKFLKQVIGKGYLKAKLSYALRLIDGKGIKENQPEGEILLRQLSEQGYISAKVYLADKLLDGDGLSSNEAEGEKILREVAQEANEDAKIELACRLFTGDRIEQNKEEGQKKLLELVAEGSLRAMLYLGEQFINDIYCQESIDEGEKLLRQLIEKYNITKIVRDEYLKAMNALGNFLIDNNKYNSKKLEEGLSLIKLSARLGHSEAMFNLAVRFLEGRGIKRSISRGFEKLDKAILMKNNCAKIELGRRIKNGINIKKDVDKGERLIREVIEKADKNSLRNIGHYYYMKDNFEFCVTVLEEAFKKGEAEAGNDLCYILRKNQVNSKLVTVTDVEVLLKKGLENNSRISMVNYALCYATGFQKEIDWIKADKIMSKLDKIQLVLSWWYMLAKDGDAEGDLVLGWLLRYQLIKDPDSMTLNERFDIARRNGFCVPEWMYSV